MLFSRNRQPIKRTKKAEKEQSAMRENAILRARQLVECLRDIAVFNQGDIEAADDAIADIRRAIVCIKDINGAE